MASGFDDMDDDLEIVDEVISPTAAKQLSLDVSQEMRNAILERLVKENPNLRGKKLNLNILSNQVGKTYRNPTKCNFSYSIVKKKPVPLNRKRLLQDPCNLNNNRTRKPVNSDFKDVPKTSSFALISLSSDEETSVNANGSWGSSSHSSSCASSNLEDDFIDMKDGNLFSKDETDFKGSSPLQTITDPLSQCSLLTDEDLAVPEVTCVDDGNNLASQDLADPPINHNVDMEFISVKPFQGKCNFENFLAEVKKLPNPMDSLKFNANWELEAVSRQALVEAFGEPLVTDILCNTNACEDSLKPQSSESSSQNFEEIQPPRCDKVIERNVFVDAATQTEEVPSMVTEAEGRTNDQSSLDVSTFNSKPPCDDLDVDDLLDSEEEQEIIHEGPSLGDLPRTELLSFLGLCSHEEADRRRAVTLSNCVKLPRKSKRVKSKKC